MQVSAVIPAYNEEKTVGQLVTIFKNSNLFEEIIVVDDGSKDRTAFLAKEAGAIVISLPKNEGKGEALTTGVKISTSPIILFFDADLLGVTKEHLQELINPVINNEADMVIGIQPKYEELYGMSKSIPLISGQRAMKREIFEAVPNFWRVGYQIDEALSYYCKMNELRVKKIFLTGVDHIQKITKTNLVKGLWGYLRMGCSIVKIYIISRITRLLKIIFKV